MTILTMIKLPDPDDARANRDALRILAGAGVRRPFVIAAITGGRDYQLDAGELRWLVRRCAELGVTILRHGDAMGVDRRGGAEVGRLMPGVLVQTWPAQWRTREAYDPRAEFVANVHMLEGRGLEPVSVLLAFPVTFDPSTA